MSERPDTPAEPEPMDVAALPVLAAVGSVVVLVGVALLAFRLMYGTEIAETPPGPRPFPPPRLTAMPSAASPAHRPVPASIEAAMEAIVARGGAAYDPLPEGAP